MNFKVFKPIFSVLTNRYSWAAIGVFVGYFGLSGTSEEWRAVVDLGVAVATVLLLLTKEKDQNYREFKADNSVAHHDEHDDGVCMEMPSEDQSTRHYREESIGFNNK